MNNKFVKVGLAGLLAASMTACSNTPAEPSQDKTPDAANSGVYDAKGTGYGGEMNLKVTIADQKITDIELVDSLSLIHILLLTMSLNLARTLGATRTVNVAQEKLPDVMRELGMKEGFDVGLEMSGAQSGFNDMVNNMKNGGKIALLGLQKADARINWEKVIFNGLTIKGIYGREMWETWYKMSTMLQSGLNIDAVITHRFDIQDYEKGFAAMNSGQSGKVVLDWSSLQKEEK